MRRRSDGVVAINQTKGPVAARTARRVWREPFFIANSVRLVDTFRPRNDGFGRHQKRLRGLRQRAGTRRLEFEDTRPRDGRMSAVSLANAILFSSIKSDLLRTDAGGCRALADPLF
jgi:hypothetical protein